MPNHIPITPEMSVDTVLSLYPQTVSVFVAHAMACVGCTISGFHSLREVAEVYNLDLTAWLAELSLATEPTPPSPDNVTKVTKSK